ncbi:MAG TPA: septum formation initiator family protein [Vicinamibacterales bacterium]
MTEQEIRRRGTTAAQERRPAPRRIWSHAMLLVACILLVNAVFGDRGLMEMLGARRTAAAALADLALLRAQNAQLRTDVSRLRDDPQTIESVARARLGLVRPGEILITIHDAR